MALPTQANVGTTALALLVTLSLFWGGAFSLTKIALDSAPPALIVATRLVIGGLLLLALYAASTRRAPRPGRFLLPFLLIGLSGHIVPFLAITWGQQAVPSGHAAVMVATTPLMIVAMAHVWVPEESLRRGQLLGFLLGFAGVAVMFSESLLAADIPLASAPRYAALLVGALGYATSTTLARLYVRDDPLHTATAVLFLSAALMSPALVVTDMATVFREMSPPGWMALAGLGVLATGLGNWIYFRLIQVNGASFAGLVGYLVPMWAVFLGIAFLDEVLSLTVMCGLALILAGVFLAQQRGSRVS